MKIEIHNHEGRPSLLVGFSIASTKLEQNHLQIIPTPTRYKDTKIQCVNSHSQNYCAEWQFLLFHSVLHTDSVSVGDPYWTVLYFSVLIPKTVSETGQSVVSIDKSGLKGAKLVFLAYFWPFFGFLWPQNGQNSLNTADTGLKLWQHKLDNILGYRESTKRPRALREKKREGLRPLRFFRSAQGSSKKYTYKNCPPDPNSHWFQSIFQASTSPTNRFIEECGLRELLVA